MTDNYISKEIAIRYVGQDGVGCSCIGVGLAKLSQCGYPYGVSGTRKKAIMRRHLLTIAIAATAVLPVGPVSANPVAAVLACLDLPDGPPRLACFNQNAPALRGMAPPPPVSAGAPPLAGPVQAPPSPEQRFAAEQVRRPAPPETAAPEELRAVVTSIAQDKSGRLVFTLANGQVWAQRETASVPVKAGGTVIIRPGLLGTYNLVPEGRNATTKVRRVK